MRNWHERFSPRVVLVTDPAYGDDGIVRCVEQAAAAMPAGCLAVQLRDKQRARTSLRVFAQQLRVVTRAAGAALLVNGDAEIARDVGADGVHLGGGAGTVAKARATMGSARAWVTVAAHSRHDVEKAVAEGADAVLVSPVFDSGRKKGRGLGALTEARAIVGVRPRARLSIVALGGVDARSVPQCLSAGADAVAVVRALLDCAEPCRAARDIFGAMTPWLDAASVWPR
jgi:thiamine-phosphate pyrophosphorylase